MYSANDHTINLKMKFFLTAVFSLTLTATVSAYNSIPGIEYKDKIYDKNIKTVLLHREGWELSNPVIKLGTSETLRLSFDDMNTDIKDYSYTFIHCSADWTPSDMMEHDYTKGFMENSITDYRFSFNTTIDYVHYSFSFPNNDVQLTKSGNYILLVYKNFDRKNIVLTRRFMIVDPRFEIAAEVKQPLLFDYKLTSHEIDFTVTAPEPGIDPYRDIKVVLMQNNRWDNAITGLKPFLIQENRFVYDYDEENIFYAGKEYLYFDCKSVRFKSEQIQQILYQDSLYHIQLRKDEAKASRIYFYHEDINGKYVVRIQEGDDPAVDADYVNVYFSLPYDYPLTHGRVYVFGALTNWELNKTNEMVYNYDKKEYQLRLMLKQGYYNYTYALVENKSKSADVSYFMGSNYQTENDYMILVYYRSIASRYDELAGYKVVNSLKK